MRQFKDNIGESWWVDINLQSRADVLISSGFDIFNLDPANLTALADDPCMMVSAVGCLCEIQIARRELTPCSLPPASPATSLTKPISVLYSIATSTPCRPPRAKSTKPTKPPSRRSTKATQGRRLRGKGDLRAGDDRPH